MTTHRIPHRVERTKNKHSRAVYRDNTIVIRLARGLSGAEEHDHITSLLRSMHRQLLQETRKKAVDPFRPLLEGKQSLTITLASGKQYHFSLYPGKRTKTTRTPGGFRIEVSPQIRRRSLHRLLWSLLSEAERPRITALTARFNLRTLRARIRPVRLCIATSQWGSCSPYGTIMINSALLFLPPSILKYIIIHELAHCRHRDHSRVFWRCVARYMPQYKKAWEGLKDYRLPSL